MKQEIFMPTSSRLKLNLKNHLKLIEKINSNIYIYICDKSRHKVKDSGWMDWNG